MVPIRRILILAAFLTAGVFSPFHPAASQETERITDFDSHITIHQSGSISVTETIRVFCAGREIKRGIVRDFPTQKRLKSGKVVTVPFEVVEVQKDGKTEPYHIKTVSGGKKIYIGDKDIFLKSGYYTYRITYETGRQLGFFDKFDELYWNVTGNDWTFVIERARGSVQLPPGARILQKAAYTGPRGARGSDFTIESETEGSIAFASTVPLYPGEGLTIAVGWPKGFVQEPAGARYYFQDNALILIPMIGFALLFIYFIAAWIRVGRDPEKGTIIPLFEPPRGITPAASRFVMKMGYDHKTFASAIVNMAVKGHLKIIEEKKKFSLTRISKPTDALSPRERKVSEHLFSSGNSINLENKNHVTIDKAVKALKDGLKRDFEKSYFLTNLGYFIPGIAITLISVGGIAIFASQIEIASFMGVWLSIWTIGCTALFYRVVNTWKTVGHGGFKSIAASVGVTLFAIPFAIGEIVGIGVFAYATSVYSVILLLGMVVLNILFYFLLKAPTLLGRKAMDQIEGFKQYLSVAEEHRLQVLHPPEKTPELFEKYLPYALALDVEHEWSEQFADLLAAASRDGKEYA
ncbi:MAG: DUF2207 domain-containing protein, partial [Thermodesulfobacteriota bacterium]